MSYEIKQNIPIPRRGRGLRKYPFAEMEIGDSFSLNGANPSSVRAAAHWAEQRDGTKFLIAKTPDDYRCWRTA